MAEKRESWIDSWKGILIFLVVLGHAVGMLCHYAHGETSRFMSLCYRWIYLFHMPAFFVAVGVMRGLKSFGGLGVAEVSGRQFGSFVGKKAKRLLVPYCFWGVVSVLVFLTMTAVMGRLQGTDSYYGAQMIPKEWWQPFVSLLHAGGWPNGEGFRCNSVLWFLPVMFVTLVLYGLLGGEKLKIAGDKRLRVERAGVSWPMILVCFAVGGVLRLYVGALPWGLDRVPRFLGFLMIGREVSKLRGLDVGALGGAGGKLKRKIRVLGVIAGLAGYSWAVTAFPDLGWTYRSWAWYWAEIGMAVLGSAISLGAAKVVDCRVLASWGVASLGIMVMHKFLIVAVQRFVGLGSWSGGSLEGCMFGVSVGLGVTVVAWAATKVVRRWAPWAIGETKSLL